MSTRNRLTNSIGVNQESARSPSCRGMTLRGEGPPLGQARATAGCVEPYQSTVAFKPSSKDTLGW